MPRRRPENGLDELVRAAAPIFSRRGFRRTQMADVAREMGVSAGALYGYVESKEALFAVTLERAWRDDLPPPPTLPVPTPPRDKLVSLARERLAPARSPTLSAALRQAAPEGGDVRAELSRLLLEIYRFLEANRQSLALLEAAAKDRPELEAVYFGAGRSGLLERLDRYIRQRVAAGFLAAVPDSRIAARLLLETMAWFTRHRHGDVDDGVQDESIAEQTVVEMLTRTLLRSAS